MFLESSINEALQKLKLDDLSFEYVPNNKEHSITVIRKKDKVIIKYSELVTLYYGLTIVKQNIHKDEFEISEDRHFKFNGSMFDCSRNEVLNIPTIKDIILTSALMGLNRFMLYTEDVYEIEGEPYFGYLRGRYTKEEIKEIVDYATSFGVDVIPCIQTLSHLNQALRWPCYSSIKDTNITLNVEKEDIYVLIEKMIKTCKENFSSKYIHIGMDEAFDMGTSAFLKENRLIDKKELMLRHLNRVVSICEKYELTPMMWIDMFFQIDPKHQPDWYDLKGKLDDSVKKEIPNVELIYWNYYDDGTSRYEENIKTSLDCKKNITFAGGLFRWIGLVGNISPSLVKSSSALKMCRKYKINSVFATTWGDASSCSTAMTLYTILALYSAFDFGNGSLKKTSKLLKAVTGLSLDDWKKLELPNKLRDELLPFENCATPYLYQDILLGLLDTRVKYEYEQKYHEHYLTLKKMSKKAGEYSYIYKYYASICDLLSYKVCLGKRIRAQYKAKDLEGLKNSVKTLKIAIKKLDVFMDNFAYEWHKENKVFGYEILDGRFGFLKQRMITALNKLNRYLNKEIDKIPELEETILPFNCTRDEDPHGFIFWNEIISVNNNN